jgi:cytochrome c biogenesis protein CcdA/thiol-disulfide isomerase/thioredoxin
MTMMVVAYLGGLLTIVSPCVLPVLPFVLTRAGQPFLRAGFPLLIGMAAAFVLTASLAAVGGGAVVAASQAARWVALAVLALFGLTLAIPSLAERLTRPLVALGGRIGDRAGDGPAGSLLLGAATGLLWAPCAGPILGILFTAAALEGANARSTALFAAFALGAATALAVVLLTGRGAVRRLRGVFGLGEGLRRLAGVAVLAGVGAIALGLDTGLLARWSAPSTTTIEQAILDRVAPSKAPASGTIAPLAALDGPADWLNSPALTAGALRGRVVLVDFWTYSCINCLRTLPYLTAWDAKYRDRGLVILGVHTPEFAFERDLGNVRAAVERYDIRYPVVTDNDYRVWRAFENRYWPAHYLIDAGGTARDRHFGEGGYAETERAIQTLLREAGARDVPDDLVDPSRNGVMAADSGAERTPETYLGYLRGEGFASPEGVKADGLLAYTLPKDLPPGRWALSGAWTVEKERALAGGAGGRIAYRFQGRDLHLVLGPTATGPVRFRVRIDGAEPGADRGADVAADGGGTIDRERLYQLIRQDRSRERLFEIEFLDPGASAYAFTFG